MKKRVKKAVPILVMLLVLFSFSAYPAFGWGFFTHPQINEDALYRPYHGDHSPPFYPDDPLGAIPEPLDFPIRFQKAGNGPDIISSAVVTHLVPRDKFDYVHNDVDFGALMREVAEGWWFEETGVEYTPRRVVIATGWLAHQEADWVTHFGNRPFPNGYSRNKITFPNSPSGSTLNHGAAEFGVDVIMYHLKGQTNTGISYHPYLIQQTSKLFAQEYNLPEGAETISKEDVRFMGTVAAGAIAVEEGAIASLPPATIAAMTIFYNDYYDGVLWYDWDIPNYSHPQGELVPIGGGYKDSVDAADLALHFVHPASENEITDDPFSAFLAEVASRAEDAGIIQVEERASPEDPEEFEAEAEITDEQAFKEIFEGTIDENLKTPSSEEDLVTARFLDGVYKRPDLSFDEVIERAEDTASPAITNLIPEGSATVNNIKPTIKADFFDADPGINPSTAKLYLGGEDKTSEAMMTDNSISYTPTTALAEGEHTVGVEVRDKAGNRAEATWTFTVVRPHLSMSMQRVYWANYSDYQNRELSVDFKLTNTGGGNALNTEVKDITATNGVTVITPQPISLETIEAGSSKTFTVKYKIPNDVRRFRTTLHASCEDEGGNVYYY